MACLTVLGLAVVLGGGASSAAAAPGEIPGRGLLPDNRGWEMVSTGDMGGFNAELYAGHSATAAGDGVAFRLRGIAPGSQTGHDISVIDAKRSSATGWTTTVDDSPEPSVPYWGLLAGSRTSPTASHTVVLSGAALTPDAHQTSEQLFLRDNSNGSYQLLTPEAQPDLGAPFSLLPYGALTGKSMTVAGHAPDFSHVAYESGFPQTADPVAAGVYNPYEWVSGQGVRLIGILPDSSCGSPPCLPSEGARIGAGEDTRFRSDAVSRDGSRIFFTVLSPGSFGPVAGPLYVRENGATTAQVNASQRTDCAGDPTCGGDGQPDPAPDPAGPLPALFWSAEEQHGSSVLFSSCEKLTDDSTADSGGAECETTSASNFTGEGGATSGHDLYVYDVESGELTDITSGDPSGADVQGVLGASADLGRIYFVAGGDLAPGATPDAQNIYLWDHGTLEFVAALTNDVSRPAELSDPYGGNTPVDGDNRGLSSSTGVGGALSTIRNTPDGRFLLFTSRARLTSYDNTNATACPVVVTPENEAHPSSEWNVDSHCAEVYRYDAAQEEIDCVSCKPGGPPGADAFLYDNGTVLGGQVPKNISDDGQRVFFQTADALVPGDANGKFDVYEWTKGGGIALISKGGGDRESLFLDASDSGNDAFFLTYDRLTPGDTDANADIYDARVGGGFPEPAVPTPCAGDGCRGPLAQAPAAGSAATSTFSGPGNPGARPHCARGKTRRHNRCVKKKRAKKKQRAAKNHGGGQK